MSISQGSVTSPKGFRAAGAAVGLKQSGALDIGLVVSDHPASLAAVFTTILIKAAPVVRGMHMLRDGKARAFYVNSGCANACTGDAGLEDAEAMAVAAAGALDISPDEVLIGSTGKIGDRLDMGKISTAASILAETLSEDGGDDFARAIMTTDTVPKSASIEVELSGGKVMIGGCAKGAGMLSPSMATMLAFLTTDAEIPAATLQDMLKTAADISFNKITVDAHMSTNDTLAIMANGSSGVDAASEEDSATFGEALGELCVHLAKGLVRDGEGATKLIEIDISGAPSDDDAELIGRKIADSSLVKCAFHGADPNWGRITSAAGSVGVDVDPKTMSLDIGSIRVFDSGEPVAFDRKAAVDYMRGNDVRVALSVGNGSGRNLLWTCDLSAEYVSINADYTT